MKTDGEGRIVNHEEALQLAYLKREESNLARCYIDLQWRPIESAPRDGTTFFALDDLGHPHIIIGDERGFYDEPVEDYRDDLRRWMPIELPQDFNA